MFNENDVLDKNVRSMVYDILDKKKINKKCNNWNYIEPVNFKIIVINLQHL